MQKKYLTKFDSFMINTLKNGEELCQLDKCLQNTAGNIKCNGKRLNNFPFKPGMRLTCQL